MRKDYCLFLSIFCFTVTLGGTGTYAQAVKEQPPPPPPWVDKDGRMKLEGAPRMVGIVGPDGKIAKDAQGNDKMVPNHINEVPPPPLR
jgi:hypothetical protein